MPSKDYIVLTGLKVSCIIGIFDWEREQKQDVVIDLKFPGDIRKASLRDHIDDTVDYKKIAKTTIAFVEKSRFHLVETLAERLAELLLKNFHLAEIDLTVSKPGAIRGSQNVGIQIHRFPAGAGTHPVVYFGLGSNIHPRENLETVLKQIHKVSPLIGLSHVYETSPVGYARQAPFWNMVVAVKNGQKPEAIRNWTHTLEKKAGRSPSSNANGPRTLDVDLLLWGDRVEKHKGFSIPHPDIEHKAFVLFPLLELDPNLVHPALGRPLIELAARFKDPSQKIRQLPSDTFDGFLPRSL